MVSEVDQNSVNQFDAYMLSIETQKFEKKNDITFDLKNSNLPENQERVLSKFLKKHRDDLVRVHAEL